MAEPQKTAATTSTYCDDNTSGGQDYSPTSSTLEQDSISPNPRRKPSKQEKDLGSPKSKSNWKDFFSRKNHGSGTADISPSFLSAKTIGSIGVPLRSCPMVSLFLRFNTLTSIYIFIHSLRTMSTCHILLIYVQRLWNPKD